MSPQVARRTRIPCVQITPNLLTVPSFAFAVLRSTLKNVNTAAINVVDEGGRFKECIDGGVPILCKARCSFCKVPRLKSMVYLFTQLVLGGFFRFLPIQVIYISNLWSVIFADFATIFIFNVFDLY